MALTSKQKILVRHSFSKIAGKSQEISQTFYERLFEVAPDLKPLFKSDMKDQGMKLIQMISAVVMSLDKFETLAPGIQTMGKRHVDYGVKKEDYETVGSALLWTLAHYFGEDWTAETEEAWAEVYRLLSDTAVSKAYTTA